MKKNKERSLTKEKLINDLGKLVSFPTITGQPEGFKEAINFIREQINPRAYIEVLENNGEPIFIASNKPGKTPDVCFLVHVDVVNANPEQFTMRLQNNIAFGRGVSDMKYSIPMKY